MGRLFLSVVGVQLYFGVNSLLENQLLVLFKLVAVFQALVLVLADQFTTNARALAHRSFLPVADFNQYYIFLNLVYKSQCGGHVNKNLIVSLPGNLSSMPVKCS